MCFKKICVSQNFCICWDSVRDLLRKSRWVRIGMDCVVFRNIGFGLGWGGASIGTVGVIGVVGFVAAVVPAVVGDGVGRGGRGGPLGCLGCDVGLSVATLGC